MYGMETCAAIEELERHDDWGVYKTLLESTKAIPWKINWATKRFDYIGPQIEELLGWPQASWLGAMDWIERIHPEDRDFTVSFCVSQSEEGVDHEADYRALTADGGYIWIRDVVHVIRDKNGVTTDLVGFMFDISERKKLEEELLAMNRKLEAWSCQDGLTGIANRRLFNQTIESEWVRGLRSKEPLSLVIFDIDHFKQYNDHYGHIGGDECLVQVARAINSVPPRANDLFARYGGEEFVLLLPATSSEGAKNMAEKCREAILELEIPHAGSSAGPFVSISVGVSTVVPVAESTHGVLIERADQMLYQAKRAGRNRVFAA